MGIFPTQCEGWIERILLSAFGNVLSKSDVICYMDMFPFHHNQERKPFRCLISTLLLK